MRMCMYLRVNSTDAFFIVLKGEIRRTADRCKLSAVLPSKGVAKSVVVGERIADGIVVPHQQAERKLCLLKLVAHK